MVCSYKSTYFKVYVDRSSDPDHQGYSANLKIINNSPRTRRILNRFQNGRGLFLWNGNPPWPPKVCHPEHGERLPNLPKWHLRPDGQLLPISAVLAQRLWRSDLPSSILKFYDFDPLKRLFWCENVKTILYVRQLEYLRHIFSFFLLLRNIVIGWK